MWARTMVVLSTFAKGANKKSALAMVSLHYEVSTALGPQNSKLHSRISSVAGNSLSTLLRPEYIIAALTDLLLRLHT